jgi:glycosidase
VIRPKGWYTGNFLPGARDRLAEQVEGFTLKELREAVQDHDLSFSALDLWPTVVVGNHDRPRVYSLYGRLVRPEHRDQMAKLVAAFTILSKGTPFIYYGEEIGMENMVFESVNEFKDNFGVCLYETLVNEGKLSPEDALVYAQKVTRDVSRTPMQWDGTLQAGFSSNPKTWLRVNPDHVTKNVQAQLAKPDSIYNFYKRLIELRKSQPAFCEGEYVWVDENSNDYLAFLRRGKDDIFLVALNFSEQALDIPVNFEEYGIKSNGVKIILSSHFRSLIENYSTLSLQPVETLIGKLT